MDKKMEIELMPCPHCGGTDLQVDYNGVYERHFVRCYNFSCHMQGPEVYGREKAADAWNKLPRALVWSDENPKQEGWYILRKKESDKPIPEFCMHFHHTKNGFRHCIAFFDDEEINAKQGVIEEDCGKKFFFAGPIPEPGKVER